MTVGIQKTLWGYDKFIGQNSDKLAHLYKVHPEAFKDAMTMILKYWEFYDELGYTLEDKLEPFKSWFLRATPPESLTRCYRYLRQTGVIPSNNNDEGAW